MRFWITLGFSLLLLLRWGNFKVSAQDRGMHDVLFLKNHWILKGKVETAGLDSVKITLLGGSILLFSTKEVVHQGREKDADETQYRRSGYSNYTELGPLASKNTSQINVNTSAFSFQTVHGYKFVPLVFIGVGAGVDLYATQTFAPLFLSVRGDLLTKGQVVPYYFLDGGYGFNVTSYTDSPFDGRGGLLYALGGGIKINFNKSSGFLLSLGYRVQEVSIQERATSVINFSRYERVALRAGFYF